MGRYALVVPYTGNTSSSVGSNAWVKDASCLDLDPEIFEVGLTDELLDGKVDPLDWFNNQRDRMIEAGKICNGCPVKTECGQEATEPDSSWTMRGGVDPVNSRMWRKEVRARLPEGTRLCRTGRHEMTPENSYDSKDGIKCRQCVNKRRREFRKKERARRVESRRAVVH